MKQQTGSAGMTLPLTFTAPHIRSLRALEAGRNRASLVLSLPTLLVLAACGSGGGDSTTLSEPVPDASAPSISTADQPTNDGPTELLPMPDSPQVMQPLVETPVASPTQPADDEPSTPPDAEVDADPIAPPPMDPLPEESPAAEPALVPRVDVVDLDGLYPYRPDGRHAAVLAECALIDDARDGCTLATLPFISQETNAPTVDDVMERLLVTHDWMGERFEQILRNRSTELLPLFGSVTSVAIGSTVRPSNYWTGTGGIQLDPAGLWLTVEEKANISIVEDFRAPFRSLLAFRNLWTIHVDGQSIFGRFGLEDRSERSFSDIERPTMSLLFHELAHANDFLPPNATPLLNRSLPPAFALGSLADTWLSGSLDMRLPLNSDLLNELAGVRFRGDTPTPAQQSVSGTAAGAEMANDGATHFYSYSTIREDFANLFEAVQMKRVYDADLHIAYVSQPADPERFDCGDLLVEWGVLNRLGDPTVRNRANDVTQSIYGADASLDTFLASLEGTETPMEVGVDWCSNLARSALPVAATSRAGARGVDPATTMPDMSYSHERRHEVAGPQRLVR